MAFTSERHYRLSQRCLLIDGSRNLRRALLGSVSVLLLSFFLNTSLATVDARSYYLSPQLATRTLKVVTIGPGCGGFVGHVIIDLESENNEAGLGFTLNFNPAILTSPVVTIGAYAQSRGFVLTVNENNVANGQIGILLDTGGPGFQLSPPDRRVVQIAFNVVPGSPTGPSPVTFAPNTVPLPPTLRSTSDASGNLLPTVYQDGSLMIGGTGCNTSSDVSVGGRVMTPDGGGLRGAQVVLTDSKGNRRTITTSSLGYYQLDGVKSGETYVIAVVSRRYRFSSRVVQVTDNLADLDFVGLE